MLATCTDIPLYRATADTYRAVPPTAAAAAAIWWAYAAAVTLALLDGMFYWALTSCWGGWFGDIYCVLWYMDWAAQAPDGEGAQKP